MAEPLRPRRSMLYVPGHNPRFLAKAREVPADAVILDLHRSVPPALKAEARARVAAALAEGGFGHRERVVGVNDLDGPWGRDDLEALAGLALDAVLLPRVESAEDVMRGLEAMEAAGVAAAVMATIETPLGVLRAAEIAAASARLTCLVMNTTDLGAALHVPATADRLGVLASLAQVVLAARAHGKAVVDGAHLELDNPVTCELSCRQGRDLGFDGKSVIHPAQLPYTNDAFTPRPKDVEEARAVLAAWEQAGGPTLHRGRLIEPAHVEVARRTLALAEACAARAAAGG
ncbi:HpcH/HpaI aldolase/citrate lyase family protein [Inmirania thermothiophila]|uniref:Citrate lyase subunit beta/citryl-CoA lyase n=1 Tax=Inmirania thermothiophila TaxID=1750597 RepID=A0A3N1Y1Q6_9GAMM|nr:CoA ester lyase [Inmirania thermothiophila]ROR32765.1 citrate lyase subunit beta/citryl-CoA lyase [Inmirania thermothiophila]